MQLPAQLAAKGWPRTRFVRLLLVLGGLVLGQVILHGPSLCGWKVMLPLDLLASPRYYLPDTAEYAGARPDNLYQMDLVSMIEPYRRFAASELAAGRWPRWMDYQFGGVPFNEPIFSPFSLLQYGFRSPLVLPWVQLLAALVAGGGAYVFFRRVMRVSFWPAAVASWCYPLTGFFVFWQGYPTSMAVYWLPWVLLAVEGTVRGRKRLAPVGLSLVTGLVLVSGHLDVAGQVLLASGIYALWRLMRVRPRTWFLAPGLRAASVLGSAWGLGFLLAMPYLLPLLDHTQTSARLERRQAGYEERPPGSLAALPQVVLPDMYGAYGPQKRGTYRFVADNQMESSAATYAGILATLVLAPLAWCRRRGRAEAWFWLGLSVLGLGWCLDLPGIVQVLRLPGLNLLSHNRFVFIAAFGLLSLSAVGLEVVRRGVGPWRRWFWLPVGVLALLSTWCGYRAVFLPEPIASQLGQAISAGQPMGWLRTVTEVSGVRDWFVGSYLQSLLLCGLGLAAWGLLRREDAVRNRGLDAGGPGGGDVGGLDLVCSRPNRAGRSALVLSETAGAGGDRAGDAWADYRLRLFAGQPGRSGGVAGCARLRRSGPGAHGGAADGRGRGGFPFSELWSDAIPGAAGGTDSGWRDAAFANHGSARGSICGLSWSTVGGEPASVHRSGLLGNGESQGVAASVCARPRGDGV